MPDDFQALPPPVPPNRPASYEERYAEVSFRKPEKQAFRWRVAALLAGIGLTALLALGILWQRSAPPPGVTTKIALPAPPPLLPEVDAVTEYRALHGTWEATSLMIDGKKATDDDVAKVRLALPGSKTFLLVLPNARYEGEWPVDLIAAPRQIDFVQKDGRRLRAIYRMDRDNLLLCLGAMDGDRPTDFTAEQGSGRTVVLLKRLEKP